MKNQSKFKFIEFFWKSYSRREKKSKIKYQNNGRGFTLIETLVAITILVAAVTGPMSLASKGLAFSQYAKDEVTAFYLANEALDVVRNIRDSNIRSELSWLKLPADDGSEDTLLTECGGSDGCFFDVWDNPVDIKSNFYPAAKDTVIKMCKGEETTYFGYTFKSLGQICPDDKIENTIFSRKVIIKDVGPAEIRVSVLVSWFANNGLERSVLITENLFELSYL